ncbi:MAG: hypothetical protein QM490_05680 [Candidatus Gracilibacteria bacterium]
MTKIKTLKELREFILYLEEKYNLLDFEIDGVKPWQLMRVQIDYDLGKVCGVMETPHTPMSLKDKIINSLSIVYSCIFKNPFFAKKTDILVFPHSRVKNVDDEMIDIYTHYFVEDLQKNNKNFIEIENPTMGKHYKRKESWRYYNDFILVYKNIFSKFMKIQEVDYKFIKTVEQEIAEKIGNYDLTHLFLNTVKKYKVEYFLYTKLLKKLQPKQVYLVVSYGGFGSLIKAAKDLGIETIEFQHGNFSKYHFGYYFGEDKKRLDYFPDKFLVWNEYWKNLINFPIEDKNVIIRPFDFLENKRKSYSHIKRIKNQVVVLSQGVLGDHIAKKILDNWEYFKQFDIKYKLHPGEYDRWHSYKALQQLNKYDNIEVITNTDLYQLFSESEYQIGVYSTALSEGVEFGCKTILLDLAGIEEMYRFREIYDVEVV